MHYCDTLCMYVAFKHKACAEVGMLTKGAVRILLLHIGCNVCFFLPTDVTFAVDASEEVRRSV
jgi:hypothetical protein